MVANFKQQLVNVFLAISSGIGAGFTTIGLADASVCVSVDLSLTLLVEIGNVGVDSALLMGSISFFCKPGYQDIKPDLPVTHIFIDKQKNLVTNKLVLSLMDKYTGELLLMELALDQESMFEQSIYLEFADGSMLG